MRLGLHALGIGTGAERAIIDAVAIADVAELADLGVDELVIVDSPPDDAREAGGWVSGLADQWIEGR
jgi:hypothetical protein